MEHSKKLGVSDPQSSPKARGKRLKMARMVLDLTRQSLEKKYQISASTIQAWEAAKFSGLSKRGATRVLAAFNQEGLVCSLDWLLYGIGAPPQIADDLTQNSAENLLHYSSLPENIVQELIMFRSLHENSIGMIVTDDGLYPYYQPGDYVAGKSRSGEAIKSLLDVNCIVETSHNEILLRRLKPGSRDDLFNLMCTNPDTSVRTFTLYDQQIRAAAPVIWHRRTMGMASMA